MGYSFLVLCIKSRFQHLVLGPDLEVVLLGLSGRVDARSSPTSFALAPFSSPALSLYSRPRA